MSPHAEKLLNWIRHGNDLWRGHTPLTQFDDIEATSPFQEIEDPRHRRRVARQACNELLAAGLLTSAPGHGRHVRSYWVHEQVHHG